MLDQVAYGALVRAKRGQKKLTQETLALDVFGDSTRKGDISRIENGKVAPQEATIQKINSVLGITEAEMIPIRQARVTARDLDNLPALDRDDLELLATRFQITDAPDLSPRQLRDLLHEKAKDYRALRKEVDDLRTVSPRLANQHAAAMDALDNLRIEEAEEILANAREILTEQLREPLAINAQLMEAQATAALTRGDVEAAYTLLSAAADSFAAIDPLEPARRRILSYFAILRNHGLRFGGRGLPLSRELLAPVLTKSIKAEDDWLWGAGQNALAIALQNQGTRTGGEDGTRLMAEAVAAYRAALTIYTKADHPVDWAMTQNNLGTALQDQGTRTGGEDGTRLRAEAVTAYRTALTIHTKADHPVDWAMTQNNLGIALRNQGSRIGGEDGTRLMAEAVAAYRAALTIHTKADHPVDWAMTQNNLGIALQDQGIRTGGEDGTRLLAEAVAAFRAALTIRTKGDQPVNWAMTQNNLGAALVDKGTRTGGEDGTRLMAEAVAAYRAALTIHTKADHPVQWATTQRNLAIAELAIADHDATRNPRPHLEAALAHVEAALTVYDPDHMSYDYGTATRLRDHLKARLADRG